MGRQKKIMTVVGARPHFMKSAALSKALAASDRLKEVIVHSGQHYDESLSGRFFEELDVRLPTYNLGIGSAEPNRQIGECLIKLDEVIQEEMPDLVVVFGDTNTTAAGAIAAKKRNIPLAHIEAGLREFDKSIPEEINKLITDSISDYYFTPTITGLRNLASQGIIDNVYLTGDITLDLLIDASYEQSNAFKARFQLPSRYVFMSCHRAANTDEECNLRAILEAAAEIELPIFFAAHPRTQAVIKKYDLESIIERSQIILSQPIGYWDTQNMIRNAEFVLTDSGGIIKECYYHRIQAVIIDKQTEWMETVEEGWHIIAGPHKAKIADAIMNLDRPTSNLRSLGDGTAGLKIVEVLEQI